jgi:putative endonuclease
MDKKTIGNWGELLARKYLQNNNYEILATNWRYKRWELDIIAYRQRILVGVEVKTRSNSQNPSSTILKVSQVGRLRKTLAKYCQINRLDYNNSRLDLILITKQSQKTVKLKHYPQI